ncbi:hypothetical protein H8356DRAFT_944434 [Neocallimastix lanati (nom. inval.)]|nr:hypothetical protein H8356DRAFT_944434 [Neocallimastix sp. JGI-2020a]
MATFKKIDPANMAETSNLVHVFNISPESTEKKIIDFFQYCGDIIEYEIVEVENGFEALLLFDKAVDTAILLNNSRIDDRNIIVKKYDDAVKEIADAAAVADAADAAEVTPSSTSRLANFIADRMIQAEQISKSIDSKLGVTEKFQYLVEESKKLRDSVDAKYGITEKTARATAAVNAKIDEIKNNEKVTAARNVAQPRYEAAKSAAQPTIENIKHSSTVMKIQETYNQVKEKVNEVTQETIKIKKSKTLKLSSEGDAAAVSPVSSSETPAPEGAAAAAEVKPNEAQAAPTETTTTTNTTTQN